MKILIIDSDRTWAELERDYLQVNGFSSDIAEDGEEGLDLALKGDYTAVISEINTGKQNGLWVCSELRQKKDIPFIFVSEKNADIDKVRAFTVGADDYVLKPFSPSELIARLKGHIARYERLLNKTAPIKPSVIAVRDLKIDKTAHRVWIRGKEVPMPIREYELLLFLAENPNIVFSKERLFDRLWGMDAMGDVSTVTVHIQRIREKIEHPNDSKKYIETVWGAGYRFKS